MRLTYSRDKDIFDGKIKEKLMYKKKRNKTKNNLDSTKQSLARARDLSIH